MRTQVGIIGGGPAGLLLSHLLHLQGIDSVVLEARSREYCENRIRAGLMEHDSAQLMRDIGLGERMDRIGLVHEGIVLRFDGRSHRIPVTELSGKQVMIYGQHEVVRDLIKARVEAQAALLFETSDVAIHDYETDAPRITFRHDGRDQVLECDVIAGCDGFHGICRQTLPDGFIRDYDRIYPFGWLGILADVAPSHDELIYANHENGFALLTMRSSTVSRLYLQCAPDEDIDQWSDDRIWSELRVRLSDNEGFELKDGPITQKGVTAMRSFVAEPMRSGRLFLAGDAAHIVPPTGAKGMNLAFADISVLARGLVNWFKHGDAEGLETYSDVALRRVWKAQRFSWWLTTLMHKFDAHTPFERRVQIAELDYVTGSKAGMTTIAEQYVGLPLM
jgi:p-hydroxybenzoate 3-monooxygenase